jgi:hypothetical protein
VLETAWSKKSSTVCEKPVKVGSCKFLKDLHRMRNAYEIRETFSKEGKRLSRERAIGPIVPWAIVALATLLSGKGIVSLPASLWQFFGR